VDVGEDLFEYGWGGWGVVEFLIVFVEESVFGY
jgi:hypothetical protein